MNTCDTCKWWEDFQLSNPAGACHNPKLVDWSVFPDKLSAFDDVGVSRRPSTGPKFGCVHHEATEAAQA